jgi:hypothetical protein
MSGSVPPRASTTTRRQFINGSSAMVASALVVGTVSQSACSGGAASGEPAAAAASNTSPGDFTAQPAVTTYVPRCWLEASDLVASGLADGASVSLWADRTDNSYNLQFQPTIPDIKGVWTHTPPTLKLNAINGLPAVSFSAPHNQSLIWTPGGSLDQELTGFSAVFVMRPDTSIIYDAAFLFITHTADQDTRIGIIFNPTQGGVRAIVETNGVEYNLPDLDAQPQGIAFGALNAPEWGILSLRVWYGLNPNATLQVNSVSTNIELPGAVTPTTPSYMDVLCSTSEINHLTCEIAEMSFYPGYLADAQLSTIMTGLQQKYALPA